MKNYIPPNDQMGMGENKIQRKLFNFINVIITATAVIQQLTELLCTVQKCFIDTILFNPRNPLREDIILSLLYR